MTFFDGEVAVLAESLETDGLQPHSSGLLAASNFSSQLYRSVSAKERISYVHARWLAAKGISRTANAAKGTVLNVKAPSLNAGSKHIHQLIFQASPIRSSSYADESRSPSPDEVSGD